MPTRAASSRWMSSRRLLEILGCSAANLKTSTGVEFAAAMFNEFDVNDDGVLEL